MSPAVDGGIDHSKYTREWLEQVIQSNISPKIDDLHILQLPLDAQKSVFVVEVRRSIRAPHQESQTKRYYKRYNFRSAPMEDYEISDIRNRINVYPPLLNVELNLDRGVFIELTVENIGPATASDITFQFSEQVVWKRGFPPQLKDGIKYLSQGQRLSFLYSDVRETFSENSKVVKSFAVSVSYWHPQAAQRVTEIFQLDIGTYERDRIASRTVTLLTPNMSESLFSEGSLSFGRKSPLKIASRI
jgi:hypothetical protein